MARKSYAKKSRSRGGNIQPAVQTMTFITPLIPVSGTNTKLYVDLSQVASLVNRRFYRQGLNWAVAGIKILSPAGYTGSVAVSKLPNTWVMSNSWEKSMRTWSKMNNEAIAEAGSIRPKFLDFKVFADEEHHVAGVAANMLPSASSGVPFAPGEWEYSKVYVPVARDQTQAAGLDTLVDFEIIATGANYPGNGASGLNAVSLIEGYASSRGLPEVLDPNAPADAADTVGSQPENWMTAIFNEGETQSHEIIEDLIQENNQAPYPYENDGINVDTQYPGGANQGVGLQTHDLEYMTSTSIGGTTRIKGGNFPCGLIKFEFGNTTAGEEQLVILLDLIPGNHRGYLCEPMTEM